MSETKLNDGDVSLDESLRRAYGDTAVFSRVGKFTLIHLDDPTPEEVEQRTSEFQPDDFFLDDCPLCRQAREEGGHVVYDRAVDGPNEEDIDPDGV